MSYDPFTTPTPSPAPAPAPPPAPQENRQSGNTVAVVIVLAVAAVLVVGVLAALVALWLFSSERDESAEPATPAVVTPFDADQEALAHAEALGFTPVAYQMDIMEIHGYYSEVASSGKLYEELIPATEEGVDYVYAFMMVVTDHKTAGMFGATFDGETRDEFANLELQFLTVSDMDLDVHITKSDGSVFEHDGTAPEHPSD